MSITNLIENVKTAEVPVFTLFIVVAFALGILMLCISIIIHLVRKVRVLAKARYGFGGKPLFSIIIVLMLLVFLPITMYATYKSIDYINLARAERDVIVEIRTEKVTDEIYQVVFMAVPTIDGTAWQDKDYDITWHIEGEVILEKVEKNKNSENPSYFVTELPRGSYRIKVQVESEDFNVIKTEEMSIEE